MSLQFDESVFLVELISRHVTVCLQENLLQPDALDVFFDFLHEFCTESLMLTRAAYTEFVYHIFILCL